MGSCKAECMCAAVAAAPVIHDFFFDLLVLLLSSSVIVVEAVFRPTAFSSPPKLLPIVSSLNFSLAACAQFQLITKLPRAD